MNFKLLLWITCTTFLLVSCARSPENFYFGDYSEAELLFNKGEYKRAIQKYQAYVDENPEGHMSVISKYYIGKSYAELGETGEAKAIFKDIAESHPDLVWANFAQTQLQELEKVST